MDKCFNGHKLLWSRESDFEYPTYSCDICKERGFPSSRGRWQCSGCNFDICAQCKPDQPDLSKCENGHELEWYIQENKLYSCSMCKLRPLPSSSGRWRCHICDYDLCRSCRSPPEKYKQYCAHNHKLVWIALDTEFDCAYCRIYSGEARWACSQCMWYICTLCRPPQISTLNCQNEHSLEWSAKIAPINQPFYTCSICLMTGFKNSSERWNCPKCEYDVCTSCRPAQSDPIVANSEKENNLLEQEIKEVDSTVKFSEVQENNNVQPTYNKCKICTLEKEPYAIIPCGHPNYCAACLKKTQVCPACGAEIIGTLKLVVEHII